MKAFHLVIKTSATSAPSIARLMARHRDVFLPLEANCVERNRNESSLPNLTLPFNTTRGFLSPFGGSRVLFPNCGQ